VEYDGFENELYVSHPQWKAHDGAIEPVGIDQALAIMPDAETAFIEFVQTDDKLYVFTAGGGSRSQGSQALRTFTVAVSRDALTEQVRLLQRQVASHNLGFRATASALYKTLIAPAGLDLAHTRRLIVVPDGVLWELPFQVLMNPEGRYLLDDCAISYAPSLTALKAMTEVKRQRRSHPAATELLAMGDPALERSLEGQVKALYRDETFGQLPLAKTEVESLGRIYAEPRRIYVGAEARESRFKAEAGGARVLHLATHAVLNNASPLYSYLLLTGDPAGGADDGLLEARELLGMNLNAELVVLSACETARGRVGAGEGVIGLSWALLVSGVPTMVLSQWKVASDSTSTFMTAFHQNRKKNMGDAEALRAAAISLRKNPAYQHPFYWAAFTLIGAGLN
jgi:CHAT domain-containing protein